MEAIRPRQGRRLRLGVPLRPGAHRQLERTGRHDMEHRRRAAQRVQRGAGQRQAAATVDGKDPRALWKLGASADFGRCKGARKDGNNCTMHVNRSLTEYCAYHAASALKAFRQSDRMNVGVRRAPKFTVNGRTVLGTKGEFICISVWAIGLTACFVQLSQETGRLLTCRRVRTRGATGRTPPVPPTEAPTSTNSPHGRTARRNVV